METDLPSTSSIAADPYDVVIIGAGFSGLGMAAALLKEGRRSFVVLEKADAVGGAWRDNTYPGCACDISSHLYSFSFAPEPNWSRMYPSQPEIRAYLERCAKAFRITPHLRFGQEARRMTWSDEHARWTIETAAGARFEARAIVSGMGGLHKPRFPEVPGRERFEGPSWHSAQWRHDTPLEGKRVAVIGTGASAIQFVPKIQPKVAALDLYQRSPAWIFPKRDRDMWDIERGLFAILPPTQELYRRAIWGLNELRGLAFLDATRTQHAESLARKFIARSISDPALREKLTPDYRLGCKRVLISNDFYPAVQQPNVHLLTDPIEEILPTGLRLRTGEVRPADILIFGTGFKAMDVLNPAEVRGRGGRSMNAEWSEKPPEAYWGVTVSGYPNFFLLMGPNTGLGHNSMVFMIESQIAFVMDALRALDARGARALDVRPSAQDGFIRLVDQRLSDTVWSSGCQSWYLSEDGRNRSIWPGLTYEYRQAVRRVNPADFEFV